MMTSFMRRFRCWMTKLEYLRRLVRGIRKDVSYGIWNARDDELFNDIPGIFPRRVC